MKGDGPSCHCDVVIEDVITFIYKIEPILSKQCLQIKKTN